MGARNQRQQRIAAEMQRVVAELISREVKDPRVGMVTITAVELASDMSVAKILFVPFGGKNPAEAVLEGLNRASGYLRGEVGRRLSLRHAPRLDFQIDVAIERADRLTRLIDTAVKQDRHEPAADRDAGASDADDADVVGSPDSKPSR